MKETHNFEKAFARLEKILEIMNSGKASLDDSLSLYQEADALINECSMRLNQAEQTIEMLVKNRNGELVLDEEKKPMKRDFSESMPS